MLAHGYGDHYDMPWWGAVTARFDALGYDTVEASFDSLGQTTDSPTAYSQHVADAIDESYDEIVVFGHSMGGLVSRYAVEHEGFDDVVDTVITLGSPHHGTLAAVPFGIAGNAGARAMSPGSDVIKAFQDEGPADTVNYLNLYAANDPLVSPQRAHLDHENATNVQIGREPVTVMSDAYRAWFDANTALMHDWLKDTTDILNGQLGIPRILNPFRQGKRACNAYQMAVPDEDDLTGHMSLLTSDRVWDTIETYLERSEA